MKQLTYCGIFSGYDTSSVTSLALGLTEERRLQLIANLTFVEINGSFFSHCSHSCTTCRTCQSFLYSLSVQDHFINDRLWYFLNEVYRLNLKDAATAWEAYRAS